MIHVLLQGCFATPVVLFCLRFLIHITMEQNIKCMSSSDKHYFDRADFIQFSLDLFVECKNYKIVGVSNLNANMKYFCNSFTN